jgi:hypothetical protein
MMLRKMSKTKSGRALRKIEVKYLMISITFVKRPTARISHLFMMLPRLRTLVDDACREKKLTSIPLGRFNINKQRLILLDAILREYGEELDDNALRNLIRTVLDTDDLRTLVTAVLGSSETTSLSWLDKLRSAWGNDRSRLEAKLQMLRSDARNMDDAHFLSLVPSIVDRDPLLADFGSSLIHLALDQLQSAITQKASTLVFRARQIQEDQMRKVFEQELKNVKELEFMAAHEEFLDSVDAMFLSTNLNKK